MLKSHLCESYNVIVDDPKAIYNLVNPNKANHSKENWNDIFKAVLNRPSFDSIVKMLELNTGNKIIFVVERMNAKLLKRDFDEMKLFFYWIKLG